MVASGITQHAIAFARVCEFSLILANLEDLVPSEVFTRNPRITLSWIINNEFWNKDSTHIRISPSMSKQLHEDYVADCQPRYVKPFYLKPRPLPQAVDRVALYVGCSMSCNDNCWCDNVLLR